MHSSCLPFVKLPNFVVVISSLSLPRAVLDVSKTFSQKCKLQQLEVRNGKCATKFYVRLVVYAAIVTL